MLIPVRPLILCAAAAHAPGRGHVFPLGSYQARTPRLAVRWLRRRVHDVADQLNPEVARPVRAWLGDAGEHERTLANLAHGHPYTYIAHDDGVRYVFTAGQVSSRTARFGEHVTRGSDRSDARPP